MDKTILVIEDNEDDAMTVVDALRRAGVKNPTRMVNDGDLAIAYLKGDAPFADRRRFPMPGVLLLDLKMPRVGGFAVLDWLQARCEFKNLLIIVLSGYQELREVQRAYNMGAHSFLIKPCTVDDIEDLTRWFAEYWEVVEDRLPYRLPNRSR